MVRNVQHADKLTGHKRHEHDLVDRLDPLDQVRALQQRIRPQHQTHCQQRPGCIAHPQPHFLIPTRIELKQRVNDHTGEQHRAGTHADPAQEFVDVRTDTSIDNRIGDGHQQRGDQALDGVLFLRHRFTPFALTRHRSAVPPLAGMALCVYNQPVTNVNAFFPREECIHI